MCGLLTLAVYLAVGQALARAGFAMSAVAILSFTAAVAFNYGVQKLWVFRDARPVHQSLPKFLVATAIGYAINVAVLMALATLPLVVAQLLAAAAVVMSNALFSFLWTFAGRTRGPRA